MNGQIESALSTFLVCLLLSGSFITIGSFAWLPSSVRGGPAWRNRKCLRSVACQASSSGGAEDEPDLFEYFDPLLSPHAYPNGISADPASASKSHIEEVNGGEKYDPLKLSSGFATEVGDSLQSLPSPDVFDPTLSPHMYPDGAPATVIGDEGTQREGALVGVLLMDHGSKKQASNDRLHELAYMYQSTVGPSVVVKAAHMELASPSIEEGLKQLLNAGVDEIVCHPFFLSPFGRHVSEDIPRIVQDAIESLQIDIPIVTTEPVGAHSDAMVKAIQTVVEQSSPTLQKRDKS